MKIIRLLILIGFAVISINANSQTTGGQTTDEQTTTWQAPGSRQEVIEWLNQEFSLYKLKNPDFPKQKIETIKFDSCYIYMNNVFEVPDGKIEDLTINLGNVTSIDYLGFRGGMILINYGAGMAYIAFDNTKEDDLLARLRKSVDYLKDFCTTTTTN